MTITIESKPTLSASSGNNHQTVSDVTGTHYASTASTRSAGPHAICRDYLGVDHVSPGRETAIDVSNRCFLAKGTVHDLAICMASEEQPTT